MDMDRRKFIKACGLGLLGFGMVKAENVFAQVAKGQYRSDLSMTGKRWAMVIDSRKCAGCNDCINACHKTHNVPEIKNQEEEVKWIWKEKFENAFPDLNQRYLSADLEKRPFLLLCNHCENPACVRVCPTKATFKREDGIVMMDYHRCIGCRYCMAACPYGARSFNFQDPRPFIPEINEKYPTRTKGVVEKCNFCTEQLSQGLLPLCAQACQKGAITCGDLNDPDSNVRKLLDAHITIQRKPNLGTFPGIYYIV
ncbi:sulfate reduction electron transfer complex DsrMKJOP subunit DsrO [Candidatus Formimonas warabiya]|uniref:4Fe-4S ferredoxin n=1 Tax=Formimonas warabiya TaxID=1761012 RepID=A0A3G1KY13_FORW1|nr:4Fe-4S dicluster domain-containing protein [Candidatus Formimonas warabiya]ATW27374.1 4Fe-4S ferredoxin [Candidatus Formimonas warabiya]